MFQPDFLLLMRGALGMKVRVGPTHRKTYPFFPNRRRRQGHLRNLYPAVASRWEGCCHENRPNDSTSEQPHRICGWIYDSDDRRGPDRLQREQIKTHECQKIVAGQFCEHEITGRAVSACTWIADEFSFRWHPVFPSAEFLPCPNPWYHTRQGRWWFVIV